VSATARYWRLVILTQADAGTFGATAIAEIQLRDSIGGTNLVGGGTASASSSTGGSETPDKAFDGNNSTQWAVFKPRWGLNADTWIQYDFGSAVTVAEVAIRSRSDTAPEQTPQTVLVRSSDDGSTWTDRALFVAETLWSLGETRTVAIPASFPATYRFWQIRGASDVFDGRIVCAELKFRDSGGTTIVSGRDGLVYANAWRAFDTPLMAFDSNTGTHWYVQGEANPSVIGGVTTDATAVPVDVQYQFYNGTDYTLGPTSLTVEASANGLDFDTVGTYTPAAWNAASQVQTFEIELGENTPTPRVTRVAAHLLTQGEGGVGARATRVSAHLLTQGEGGAGARVTRVSVHVLALEAAPELLLGTLGIDATVTAAFGSLSSSAPTPAVLTTQVSAFALVEQADADVEVDTTLLAAEVLYTAGDEVDVTLLAAEVLVKPEVDCPTYPVVFRFRVRDEADEFDLINVTSYRADGIGALIAQSPTIDGATFDPLTGKVTIGSATIQVIDPTREPCADILDETSRIITSVLLDAQGQTQLLGKKAFIEIARSFDPFVYTPHFAGYVSSVTLIDGITYEFSIAHTTRDDETTAIFGPDDPFVDARSYLLGGPVDESQGLPSGHESVRATYEQGGIWRAQVIGVYDTFIHVDINEDESGGLRPHAFPPEDLAATLADRGWIIVSNNDFQKNVFKWAERNLQKYYVQGYPSEETKEEWQDNPTGKPPIRGYFPRVGVDVLAINGMFPPNGPQRVTPMATYEHTQQILSLTRKIGNKAWEDLGNHFYLAWGADALNPQPSVGATISFRARPLDASEAAPRWCVRHPAVLLQRALQAAGYTVSSASVTAAVDAIGPIQVAMRFGPPQTVAKVVEMLCGTFGMGVRVRPDGVRHIFAWRTQQDPVDTITLDDLYAPSSQWWRTDESSQVFSVQWKFQRFETWPGEEGRNANASDRALDGVIAYDEAPITFRAGITKPSQAREQVYDIPGCLLAADGSKLDDLVDVTATWTDQMFAVFAGGAITTEIDVTHEIDADIGDEVVLELAVRPGYTGSDGEFGSVGSDGGDGYAYSRRGEPERALVIGRTPHDWGARLTLLRSPGRPETTEGSGSPSSGPPALLDDAFTLALGADPTRQVTLTLTDTSNWAGSGVQLQINYAVQVEAPDPLENWTDWPTLWTPTSPITIGPFTPGTTIWVRVRKAFTGGVFGPYTPFDDITLNTGTSTPPVGTVQTPAIFTFLDEDTGIVDVLVFAGPEAVKVYVEMKRNELPTVSEILAGVTETGSSPYEFEDLTDLTGVGPILVPEIAYIGAIAEDALGNRSIANWTVVDRRPVPIVQPPALAPELLEDGDVRLSTLPGPEAVRVYAAISKIEYPNESVIIAGLFDDTSPFIFDSMFGELEPLEPGQTGFIGAIAEDSEGRRSIPSYTEITYPLPPSSLDAALVFAFDSSPDDLENGDVQDLVLPFACRVMSWTIIAPVSGSIEFDIRKGDEFNYPPSDTDSIVGSDPPTLSSGTFQAGSAVLWDDDEFAKDDIIRVWVESADIPTATLTINVRRI
jgi:hypothetical protein